MSSGTLIRLGANGNEKFLLILLLIIVMETNNFVFQCARVCFLHFRQVNLEYTLYLCPLLLLLSPFFILFFKFSCNVVD